jgi:hypothetical protein
MMLKKGLKKTSCLKNMMLGCLPQSRTASPSAVGSQVHLVQKPQHASAQTRSCAVFCVDLESVEKSHQSHSFMENGHETPNLEGISLCSAIQCLMETDSEEFGD